jgi:hypothetical protein
MNSQEADTVESLHSLSNRPNRYFVLRNQGDHLHEKG